MQAQPTLQNFTAVTGAYDSDYTKSIKAIDVLAPGDLFVEDIEGNIVHYPLAAFVAAGGAYTCFPYRLNLRIRKIIGDGSGSIGNGIAGTDIALANLVVLH